MGASFDHDKLLTTTQVAHRLGISARTVCLWAEVGELDAIKIGRQWRIRAGTLSQWLACRQSHASSGSQTVAARIKRTG
jgi:excisionase family DNA binding protein